MPYPLSRRLLHWPIALLMLVLIPLGWWMVGLTYYSAWYTLGPWIHKGLGLLVFALGVALLGARAFTPAPAALPDHTAFEKIASKIAHWTLLAAVIVIPVSGYIFTTATGDGIPFFDLFTLPALFAVSEPVRDAAIAVHYYASYGLVAVIAAHIGGALKHHFIDRDRTLRRMISG